MAHCAAAGSPPSGCAAAIRGVRTATTQFRRPASTIPRKNRWLKLFDLVAGLLAFFYSIVSSYGGAIALLTLVISVVFTPLTYKSTKSMMKMRRLQPQIKQLQAKHKGDREQLNQEMMALYQKHEVNPLGGCLPLLVQSPVFIVLFRVIRGVTRRQSNLGQYSGELLTQAAVPGNTVTEPDNALLNFNPEYLSSDTDMYQDLVQTNEMVSWGVDLSFSASNRITEGLGTASPYLLMVIITGALSWYQQRQIAGRSAGTEINPQQQMIMKILPWMLPIFAFTMPAGLVVYFIVSALVRVITQWYITKSLYADDDLTTPIEVDEIDPEDGDDSGAAANSGGSSAGGGTFLERLTGGGQAAASTSATSRHGSRRPTGSAKSNRNRSRPPRDPVAPTDAKSASKNKGKKNRPASNTNAKSKKSEDPEPSGWARAKRRAKQEPAQPEPDTRGSRRVTPKGESSDRHNQTKRRKR